MRHFVQKRVNNTNLRTFGVAGVRSRSQRVCRFSTFGTRFVGRWPRLIREPKRPSRWHCICEPQRLMSTPSVAATSLSPADRYVRILRWRFKRNSEIISCELGLTGDDTAYQLTIDPPWNPTGVTVELFDDAMSAFQRHAMIERLLIDDGWSLESFESQRIERMQN
jgi:hypothetical protein